MVLYSRRLRWIKSSAGSRDYTPEMKSHESAWEVLSSKMLVGKTGIPSRDEVLFA